MFDFLKSFESVNGSCISGILLDGNLCFVALEIEDILGFDNLEFSIDQHLAFMREGKEYNILVGGKLTQLKAWLESQHYSLTDLYQGVKDRTKIIVLTKVGLQSLLFRWDFPQPLQSNKDWLAFEVLPAIEKIIGARSLKKKEKTGIPYIMNI